MAVLFEWAIKVLERELVDIATTLQDDEVKKDSGRVNENRKRYHEVRRAIERLNGGCCNDNNSD